MKEDLNFYSHERVSERLILVTEGYSMVHRFTIGVIIGDEKILVIDAGLGAGSGLRQYIESLTGTGKPMICAATHNHPDHMGSAKTFDEAYVSWLDYPCRNDFALNVEQRLEDLKGFALGNEEVQSYCEEHILDNHDVKCRDIRDGDVFDLGGVKIRAVWLPGHSEGSMVFYNEEEKYLFAGDSVNTDVHLKKLDREGLIRYQSHLKRLIGLAAPDTIVYPAHLPLTMDMRIAENLVSAAEDLIQGRNLEQDPPGETIFTSRNNNPDIRMHFCSNTCIVYDRKKIKKISFYSHEQVSDHIYVVTENYSMVHRFTIGVIIGEERIAVIDSGLGMTGDLRSYIESFAGTDKPMICLCTHGAIDHIGASKLFDEAYLNPLDLEMIPRAVLTERRLSDLNAFCLENKEVMEYCREHMLINEDSTFLDVREGDSFDLGGGIVVEPIATPGHSKGHLAYLCRSGNIAFVGDAINADVHIKQLDKQGLRDYASMLRRFLLIAGEDVVMYAGHLNRAHRAGVVHHLAAACEEVADGNICGDPPGETIFTEKSGNPEIRMHYHGNCCIIYNRSLLKG